MELDHGRKQTDVGVIPEDWSVKAVNEIAQIKTGPFGTLLKASEYSGDEGVPLISVGEIGAGIFKISDRTPLVPNEVVRRLPQYLLKAGDIVFGRKGAVDRSALVTDNEDGWFLGSDGISIRPQSDCHPPYLACQFQSHSVKSWLTQNATGTTMASLNQTILGRVRVPYAPLDEQPLIAEALSDADALLGVLERMITKKRDLKQAAMQQLLTGQTRLPGFKGEWEEKRLGECLLARPNYGINAAAVPFSGNLPSYLRITDITEYGRYCPSPRVSVDSPDSDQFYLEPGDLVLARTGASVGKSYLYNPNDGELVYAGFLIRVRPDPRLLEPAYLAAFVTTRTYWNWVQLNSMRSGQPGINGNEYATLPLILPPTIEEQTAIAEVLSDMDTEIAALEQRRDKTRDLKQGMMQELLTGKTRLI
ncbi:restriction endonuclease subunit S [Thalassoglobus polymorphus]|uniref:EcoKI restriction-modification system protein HsdS n=1 Tax=Thalassoglobus polymorphus TaxID=2527994 RepID=A0A517QK89_9PLAN|nr:restriction endonuclease subunit S [Thalassoglobus polymorphus]QDT32060.1 EcoKI restriction-modification system protein HsdS [Thalassoglobus polymorphus]